MNNLFVQILVWLIPVLPAIILHEVAHGWAALLLGDTTARDQKRLSLNPIRHIDVVGTIVLPGILLLVKAPFLLGWAKPVPVSFHRLKGGRLGHLLVALAGPLSNLIMLLSWGGAFLLFRRYSEGADFSEAQFEVITDLLYAGMGVNLALILFNLVPIPPLDGGRIVGALLPPVLSRPYMRLERFGIVLLLLLLLTGVFQNLFEPVLNYFFAFLP